MSNISNCAKLIKSSAYETFGVVPKGGLKRNLVATALTVAPNIPIYLIPSYSSAAKEGNTNCIKYNEGKRGLITGALDGAAVGVLTAVGDKNAMNTKRIVIFALLGASFDFIYSKVFSKLGEDMGKKVYNHKNKDKINLCHKKFCNNISKLDLTI